MRNYLKHLKDLVICGPLDPRALQFGLFHDIGEIMFSTISGRHPVTFVSFILVVSSFMFGTFPTLLH